MKKQNSVFDKFQDFWGGLKDSERKDLWDVMTALRGPDLYGSKFEVVKMHTTARIRALLIPKNKRTSMSGCFVFDTVKEINKWIKESLNYTRLSREDIVETFRTYKLDHFTQHFRNALAALEKRYSRKTKAIAKSLGIVE